MAFIFLLRKPMGRLSRRLLGVVVVVVLLLPCGELLGETDASAAGASAVDGSLRFVPAVVVGDPSVACGLVEIIAEGDRVLDGTGEGSTSMRFPLAFPGEAVVVVDAVWRTTSCVGWVDPPRLAMATVAEAEEELVAVESLPSRGFRGEITDAAGRPSLDDGMPAVCIPTGVLTEAAATTSRSLS